MSPPLPDATILLKLATMRMPFGKYAGMALMDLPLPYLVWFSSKGFPRGELGLMLEMLLEIKREGLTHLLRPLADHGTPRDPCA